VDGLVRSAGFKYYTFVQPPFYFQNFIHQMAPQPKQDGSAGWTLPIDPTKKIFHMADINDLGKVVTGALLHPEKAGNGVYLSLATELNSFNDIINAYKANGKEYDYTQVPPEVFSTFFEGAKEVAEMLRYFEKYSYMGPNSKPQIKLAKKIATKEFVSFREWISRNDQENKKQNIQNKTSKI
jgi:NmrA-like family